MFDKFLKEVAIRFPIFSIVVSKLISAVKTYLVRLSTDIWEPVINDAPKFRNILPIVESPFQSGSHFTPLDLKALYRLELKNRSRFNETHTIFCLMTDDLSSNSFWLRLTRGAIWAKYPNWERLLSSFERQKIDLLRRKVIATLISWRLLRDENLSLKEGTKTTDLMPPWTRRCAEKWVNNLLTS